jgi:hypothetical protein
LDQSLNQLTDCIFAKQKKFPSAVTYLPIVRVKDSATTKNIQTLRANSLESAICRGKKTVAGAFSKTGIPGQNLKGDTSTRGALNRIWMAGETLLRNALSAVKRLTTSTWRSEPQEVPLLPSNWGGAQSIHCLDGGRSWSGWFSMPNRVFENAARCAGWMKAMADLIGEHPGWFLRASKALAKSPTRGMNSPYNNCGSMVAWLQGSSIDRWRTPGHAFRAISAGIRRAKEILKGFNVTNVPWAVVMEELAAVRGPQRGNKLGRRLALKTLSQITGVPTTGRALAFPQFRGFRLDVWRAMAPEVQEFYRMKMRDEFFAFCEVVVPTVREDDGVKLFVLSETIVRMHVITEGYAVQTSRSRRSGKIFCNGLLKQTVIKNPSNRTFHMSWLPSEVVGQKDIVSSSYQSWGQGGYPHGSTFYVPEGHEANGQKLSGSCRFWQRFAIRLAEQAWRVQDSVQKAEGLELPADQTILVWLDDSYSAGNCQAGTQSFKNQNGWSDRQFVPAQCLLDKKPRARAAAKVALARYWASQASKVA